ncbi:MAG: hypothetical protein Q8S17_07580 [Humidesulfovibrio sp.]|nr:hypothetical protein [Humidesulfovibrio sp.]
MLAEAVKYAAARLRGQADPHGHLAQQVAIWARHKRHSAAWGPHLARAKALALASARACPEHARRTALVLGPGLLLDVPLDELAALFQKVVLADMAFVPEVRAKAARLGNVQALEVDLTGRLGLLAGAVDGALDGALDGRASGLALVAARLPELDFVYSANLLSQLPLFALDAVSAGLPTALPPGMVQQRRAELAADLVRQHLDGLKALPCPACLVTDVTERGLRQGALDYEVDLLFGVEPGLTGETWTWDLAPDGEAVRGLDVQRVVLGVSDIRTATV